MVEACPVENVKMGVYYNANSTFIASFNLSLNPTWQYLQAQHGGFVSFNFICFIISFLQKAPIPNVCKTEAGVTKANLNSEKIPSKAFEKGIDHRYLEFGFLPEALQFSTVTKASSSLPPSSPSSWVMSHDSWHDWQKNTFPLPPFNIIASSASQDNPLIGVAQIRRIYHLGWNFDGILGGASSARARWGRPPQCHQRINLSQQIRGRGILTYDKK